MDNVSPMPQCKPSLETEKSVCDGISECYSVSPKYLTVSPFVQNYQLLVIIHKEIKHIHNLIMLFEMNYKMYKRYLYVDFADKLMELMNEKFTQIYKIVNLTYNKPSSAFALEIDDMSWYCEIAKSYYLEDESSKMNLTSIFEILLEMSTLIDATNLELQDRYDSTRTKK
jgi:hypothetical protein